MSLPNILLKCTTAATELQPMCYQAFITVSKATWIKTVQIQLFPVFGVIKGLNDISADLKQH